MMSASDADKRPAKIGLPFFGALMVVAVALAVPASLPSSDDRPPLPLRDPTGLSEFELVEGDAPLHEYPPNVLPQAPEPQPEQSLWRPTSTEFEFDHYPDPDEIGAFLADLEAAFPSLVEARVAGTSWQGRDIWAVRLAAPGAQSMDDRPAVYLDGQHHARELISNQVVMYTLAWLVEQYGTDPLATRILDTRVVYAIPSVNPDGNAIALADYQGMRRTANPAASDDDGDGAFDEDWSEDFGFGTQEVWLYHFNQEWADAHGDDPFVGQWWQNLAGEPEPQGRYGGDLKSGLEPIPVFDRDGDGRQHEDEIGGVDANRNYDVHWSLGVANSGSEVFRGPSAWSEPEVRAVRELVTGVDTLATGVSHHSGVDVILHPWGWSDAEPLPDAAWYERLSRKGTALTEVHGFPGSPHTWTARGLYPAPGSTLDWLYETIGAFAWTPEVYGSSNTTFIQRIDATGTYSVGVSTWSTFNPPTDQILPSADRWRRFNTYIMAAAPNLEVGSVAIDSDRLRVEVYNDGLLPITVTGRITLASGTALPLEPMGLSAESKTWSWPLAAADLTSAHADVALVAELGSGTRPHVVERLDARLALNGDEPPSTRAWMDLGAEFGGWDAGEGWDEPGTHHRGPPLPVETDAPGAPTPTPEATVTPRPMRGWLPRLLNGPTRRGPD